MKVRARPAGYRAEDVEVEMVLEDMCMWHVHVHGHVHVHVNVNVNAVYNLRSIRVVYGGPGPTWNISPGLAVVGGVTIM